MADDVLDLKILRTNKTYSAVPIAKIRAWIAERRVLPEDLVRPPGAASWTRVAVAPELAPDEPPPVAPPPMAPPPRPTSQATAPTTARPAHPGPAANTNPSPATIGAGNTGAGAKGTTATRPTMPTAATTLPTPPVPPSTPTPRPPQPAPAGGRGDPFGIDSPAKTRRRRRLISAEDTEMDMTPMIDVTFQLLIFFMLANQLANPAPIEVPVAVHGEGLTLDGKQSILIDEAGRYFLGEAIREDNVASVDDVAAAVTANASAAEQPLDVVISAHKQSKHISVRELIDRLGKVPNVGRINVGVEEQK